MNARVRRIAGGWVVVPMVLLALTSSAAAQHPIPESQRWATITHAGNAPATVVYPSGSSVQMGQVNYEYQISRTEVSAAEWFEFVQAYAPYVAEDEAYGTYFTSDLVYPIGLREYAISSGWENRPVAVGWRFAARFCNWLHNGKATTPEAFERGVYDSSTFGFVDGMSPLGGHTDQAARSPGATYWIPTSDEWVKAAYFDPNRYGADMPGYWQYPHSSDTAPRPGRPENGGQTSAGRQREDIDIATYINVQSPWGLWDVSGGQSEMMETATFLSNGSLFLRYYAGSEYYTPASLITSFDQIGAFRGSTPTSGKYGLRIARAVPEPGSIGLLTTCIIVSSRRRRSQ